MASQSESSPALRLTFLAVLVIGMFLALFARLWFLQVLAGDRYVELADSNRLGTVVIEAPRGAIYAADGTELVRNRPALAISADRQVLLDHQGEPRDEEAELVIERLGALLEIDRDEVLTRLGSQRRSPFRPVPLEFDVAPEMVFAVREHQELFKGVVAETLPVREYPQGTTAAHLVGYLGEITQEELDDLFPDYRGGDSIGRAGLEQSYEEDLRGTPGSRLLVVNAAGNVVDVQSDRDPIQGNNLVTTLDLDLQIAVENLLEQGIIASRDIVRDDGQNLPSVAGSAIVQHARTGAILAMASYPSYDPREFVGGVSHDYWNMVTDRENFQPLLNRAVSGAYPPGSVFKVASGAAAIEAGLVGPHTEVNCPAEFEVGGNTYRNWNRGVNEGPMDLGTALMRSCDTYFYDLAFQQWQREQAQEDPEEVLPEVAERFGFGRLLGMDLPSEVSGRIPGREWRYEYWLARGDAYCAQAEELPPGSVERELLADLCQFGGVWRGGDAINASIGQGDVLSTPLQVSAAHQAVANDGVLMRPHLGDRVVDAEGEVVREFSPEVLGNLELDDATLAVMRDGLERVVMEDIPGGGGTAKEAFRGFPFDQVPVAGKTGTAEVRPRVPFAWFSGYAPSNDPEIVVTVNVEEGGGGSQTAAPIVRNIMEHYFDITPADEAEFEPGAEILD